MMSTMTILMIMMIQQEITFTFHDLFIAAPLLAVKVQQPAPDFQGIAVVGNDFQELKLSDFAGKYLVLFFYPLDL